MIDEADVIRALPRGGLIYDYVKHATSRNDAHALYHVAGALSLLTQAVPSAALLPFGTKIHPNLFVLIVADSSDRKSVAVDFAGGVLRQAIPDAVQEEPGSPAALLDGLARRPHQLVLYPEFGNILASSVTGQLHAIRTLFSQAFDCGPLGRNTLTGQREKRSSMVMEPRLSILASCSPEFLETYTDATAWGGGFMGRFLFISTGRQRDERLIDKVVTPESQAAGARVVARLADYAKGPVADLFSAGPARPDNPCLGLAPEAAALHRAWCRDRPSAILSTPIPSAVKSAIGRAETLCLKLAYLIGWDLSQAAREGDVWVIDEIAMRFAIYLADIHIDSLLRVIEVVALDRDAQDRRRILSLCNGVPRSRAELLRESGLGQRRFNEAITTLVESQRLEVRSIEESLDLCYARSDRGRPSTSRPQITLSTQLTSAEIESGIVDASFDDIFS